MESNLHIGKWKFFTTLHFIDRLLKTNSMIFQVTLGCSFNKCSFCNMYRTKEYIERPWDEIKTEIELAAQGIS